MFAIDLLRTDIPTLRTSDTLKKAVDIMSENKLFHLPIVNEVQFLGLVYENDLWAQLAVDDHAPIGSLALSTTAGCTVEPTQHLYDVLNLFVEHRVSLLPVVKQDNEFLGVIVETDLVGALAKTFSSQDTGALLALEISQNDYSMVQIAQIIESEQVQILSSSVEYFPESSKMDVTLKLNKRDVTAIVASFNRHGIAVKFIDSNAQNMAVDLDRYQSFLNYLNI